MSLTDQAKEHYNAIIETLMEAESSLTADAYLAFIECLQEDMQDHFDLLIDGRKAVPLLALIRADRGL